MGKSRYLVEVSQPGHLALPGGAAELHQAVPIVADGKYLPICIPDHGLLVNPDLDRK
jgi:hypothetical protein